MGGPTSPRRENDGEGSGRRSPAQATEKERPRSFDEKTRTACWRKAAVLAGRHPERWRLDAVGNVVCRRFWGCHGCLCYEYDHIVPFSKGLPPSPPLRPAPRLPPQALLTNPPGCPMQGRIKWISPILNPFWGLIPSLPNPSFETLCSIIIGIETM